MNASGFGTFVPFGTIPTATLFLDHAPGGVADTAILFKIEDGGSVRIFDRSLIEKRQPTPALSVHQIAADKHVIALDGYGIEIERSIDNVLWETDADFVKAAVIADDEGRLFLKAYRNRRKDDYVCVLFDLETGEVANLARATVGFRRWSIVSRTARGERIELFRFGN
ncbi:MAG: hypothetical protein WCK65_07320 [Rhodospirillaceae bacterium]